MNTNYTKARRMAVHGGSAATRVSHLMLSPLMWGAVMIGAMTLAAPARSADAPVGTWLDQTGRGAVEISYCGSNLCGRVVWLKDAVNEKACGMAILGELKPGAGGSWQGGWIYDPDREERFDVELTPIGNRLKVLGYAGIKMFGETVMWTRAPAGLKKCQA